MRLVAETKDDQAPSVHPLYEFLSFSQRLCYKPTRSYQLSMRQYVETLAGDSDDRSQHVAEKPWGVGSTKLHVIHQETREQMRAMTVWHDSRNMRRQRSKWAVKHLVKPCECSIMMKYQIDSNCMNYEECGILPTVFCNCQCHMTWLRRSSKPCRLCPSVQVGRQDGHSYLVRSRPHAKCHQNVTWMTQHDSWHSESQRITAMLPAASATPDGLPGKQSQSLQNFCLVQVQKLPASQKLQCTAMYCNTDPVLSRSNVQKEN